MFILVSGCVSVSLDRSEVRRSDAYKFAVPPSPFRAHQAPQVDHAWKNAQSGSIISVVSECAPNFDPSLQILRDDVVRSLTSLEVKAEKNLTFQGREALRTLVHGRVDGVDSAVDLLVFKKNGCSYILNLIGGPQTITPDLPRFEAFLSRFEVP